MASNSPHHKRPPFTVEGPHALASVMTTPGGRTSTRSMLPVRVPSQCRSNSGRHSNVCQRKICSNTAAARRSSPSAPLPYEASAKRNCSMSSMAMRKRSRTHCSYWRASCHPAAPQPSPPSLQSPCGRIGLTGLLIEGLLGMDQTCRQMLRMPGWEGCGSISVMHLQCRMRIGLVWQFGEAS